MFFLELATAVRHDAQMSKRGHDRYIAAAPKQFQPMLAGVRASLSRALPEAEEVIKYDMPGFQIDDKIVAGYAAFSKQCGLYVDPAAISDLSDEIKLEELKSSKTGVTFSERKPISGALVEKLAISSRKAKGL